MTGMRSLVAWPLGDCERRGGVLVIGWAVAGAIDSRTREVLAGHGGSGRPGLRAGGTPRPGDGRRSSSRRRSSASSPTSCGHRSRRSSPARGCSAGRLGDDPSDHRQCRRPRGRHRGRSRPPLPDRRGPASSLAGSSGTTCRSRRSRSTSRDSPSGWSPRRPGAGRRTGSSRRTAASVRVVRGEETYIEQVLRNLLANAAKYSPAGSTVEVRLEDHPDGVAVRVLDDGPGIARAEVEQLFTLFYRSPATAATAAGAGIGLFVSRQLVDAMGGRMWAQRRRRGGSEFGFSLGAYPFDEEELR